MSLNSLGNSAGNSSEAAERTPRIERSTEVAARSPRPSLITKTAAATSPAASQNARTANRSTANCGSGSSRRAGASGARRLAGNRKKNAAPFAPYVQMQSEQKLPIANAWTPNRKRSTTSASPTRPSASRPGRLESGAFPSRASASRNPRDTKNASPTAASGTPPTVDQVLAATSSQPEFVGSQAAAASAPASSP